MSKTDCKNQLKSWNMKPCTMYIIHIKIETEFEILNLLYKIKTRI